MSGHPVTEALVAEFAAVATDGRLLRGPMSDETKAKISAAKRGNTACAGRVISQETRDKLAEAGRKRRASPETKAKMSATRKAMGARGQPKALQRTGRAHTEATKAKISATTVGRVVPEETRRKISEALRGRPSPTKGMTGFKRSAETRQKMAEAAKAAHARNPRKPPSRAGSTASEETRAKMSAAQKGRARSAATKEAASATMKARYAAAQHHSKGQAKSPEHVERLRSAARARWAIRRAAAAQVVEAAAKAIEDAKPRPVPVMAPVTTWRRAPQKVELFCGIPCMGCGRPFDQKVDQLTRCDRCHGAKHA